MSPTGTSARSATVSRRWTVPALATIVTVVWLASTSWAAGTGHAAIIAERATVSVPAREQPLRVDANGGVGIVRDHVFGTAPGQSVTATPSGDGLTSDPPSQSSTYGDFQFFISATSPGLHTLTITFSSPGMPDISSHRFILSPGTPEMIAGGGDLSGMSRYVKHEVSTEDNGFEAEIAVHFLDKSWAYIGFPPRGLPRCSQPSTRIPGCKPYRFDATTGVVQIGDVAIGQIQDTALVLSGLIGENTTVGPGGTDERVIHDPFHVDLPLRLLAVGLHVAGHFVDDPQVDRYGSVPNYYLTLRRDGRFVLHQQPSDGGTTGSSTIRGRYRLGARGLLRLTGPFGQLSASILDCSKPLGASARPAPAYPPSAQRARLRCLAISYPENADGSGGAFRS